MNASSGRPPRPFQLAGVQIYKSLLGRAAQESLVNDLRETVAVAPLFSPKIPGGRPMSVRMSSAGELGWYADETGYRYVPCHPSGRAWPRIPEQAREIWGIVANAARLPDTCLINYYGKGAHMGMHQDKEESDFSQPVVSISLGDAALFRIGGIERGGKTQTYWVQSGDVMVLGGAARLAYHGIDLIRFGSSSLLKNNGRINLTLRVAK